MSGTTLLVKKVYRGTFLQKEGNDIPIFYDSQEIGAFCPLSGRKKEIAALTTYQKAVLDHEKTQDEQLYLPAEYEFENDYVVVKSDWESVYDQYRNGSSYWGEYCHDDHLPQSYDGILSEPTEIFIDKSIKIRTHRHQDALAKYATYSNPTDKFLFLYHCLEIDFDYQVVAKIKSLDESNPTLLGSYIRDLKSDDMDRLIYMMEPVASSLMEPHIKEIRNHGAAAKRIFYDFGKDSNPIKSYTEFEHYILNSSSISEPEFLAIKERERTSLSPKGGYDKLIRKCVCYWIYRIRCSIAHNKIGDYHIQTADDILFIIKFGIPILKSAMGKIFSTPNT